MEIREIDILEFLFSIRSDYNIVSLNNADDEYKITLSSANKVLCYQGWDILTAPNNADVRKSFNIPVEHLYNCIQRYNESNPNNKFMPTVCLKTQDSNDTFLMTVKSFHLENDQQTNAYVLTIIVDYNFKSPSTSEYLSNDNLSTNGNNAVFMMQGLNYKDLNLNNFLDHLPNLFTAREMNREFNTWGYQVASHEFLKQYNLVSLNYLFEGDFLISETENNTLLFTHNITSNTRNMIPFQGWSKESPVPNNRGFREVKTVSLEDFVEGYKFQENLLIDYHKRLGERSADNALSKYGFQPTCYFNFSEQNDDDGYYLGVIKTFNYNINLLQDLTTEISFSIEVSIDQIKDVANSFNKSKYLNTTKKVFFNIDSTVDTDPYGCETEKKDSDDSNKATVYNKEQMNKALSLAYVAARQYLDDLPVSEPEPEPSPSKEPDPEPSPSGSWWNPEPDPEPEPEPEPEPTPAPAPTPPADKDCDSACQACKTGSKFLAQTIWFSMIGVSVAVLLGSATWVIKKLIGGGNAALNKEFKEWMKNASAEDIAKAKGFFEELKGNNRAINSELANNPEGGKNLSDDLNEAADLKAYESEFVKNVPGYDEYKQMEKECARVAEDAARKYEDGSPKPMATDPDGDWATPGEFPGYDVEKYSKALDEWGEGQNKAYENAFNERMNSDKPFTIDTGSTNLLGDNITHEMTSRDIVNNYAKNFKNATANEIDKLKRITSPVYEGSARLEGKSIKDFNKKAQTRMETLNEKASEIDERAQDNDPKNTDDDYDDMHSEDGMMENERGPTEKPVYDPPYRPVEL